MTDPVRERWQAAGAGWRRRADGVRAMGMPVSTAMIDRLALDPKRVDDNIRMSARFLRFLLDQTGGTTSLALAAYYQGLARTKQGKFYEDTKKYVTGVSATRQNF